MPKGELEPKGLLDALERMPARDRQRLWFRFVEGRSTPECARLYGVDEPAFAVGLYRSARLFERALASSAPVLPTSVGAEPAAQEERRAAALTALFDSKAAPAPYPEVTGLSAPLAALAAHAPEVKALHADRERAWLESPRARRADLFRRLALLALLAAAAWLYLRNRS